MQNANTVTKLSQLLETLQTCGTTKRAHDRVYRLLRRENVDADLSNDGDTETEDDDGLTSPAQKPHVPTVQTRHQKQQLQSGASVEDAHSDGKQLSLISAPTKKLVSDEQLPRSAFLQLTSSQGSAKLTPPSIVDAFQSQKSFSLYGEKTIKGTDALLYMIVKDCLPLDVIHGDGFKNFVHMLQPQYKIPDRRTIIRKLDEKFIVG